jgi:hypothetical protein
MIKQIYQFLFRVVRPCLFWLRCEFIGHHLRRVDLKSIKKAISSTAGSPKRFLIATNIGSNFGAIKIESLIAVALAEQGFEPTVTLCDGVLPACTACSSEHFKNLETFVSEGPSAATCKSCFSGAKKHFEKMGATVVRFSDLLRTNSNGVCTEDELSKAASAGAVRFLKRNLDKTSELDDRVFKRFLAAARITDRAFDSLFSESKFEQVLINHGIYVPQGIVLCSAKRAGASIHTWTLGSRKLTVTHASGDTYHELMKVDDSWKNVEITSSRSVELTEYLRSKFDGNNDTISFAPRARTRQQKKDLETLIKKIRDNKNRRIVAIYPNVVWDASSHFSGGAFDDIEDWLLKTVRFLTQRDCLTIVRAHPAESLGLVKSNEPVEKIINDAFQVDTENLIIIPPESALSSYWLAKESDFCITLASKIAIDLSAIGIPTIVAGGGWVRDKGITTDPPSEAEYFEILENWVLNGARKMSDGELVAARKYAWWVYFDRMRTVDSIRVKKSYPHFAVKKNLIDEHGELKDARLSQLCREWTSLDGQSQPSISSQPRKL